MKNEQQVSGKVLGEITPGTIFNIPYKNNSNNRTYIKINERSSFMGSNATYFESGRLLHVRLDDNLPVNVCCEKTGTVSSWDEGKRK